LQNCINNFRMKEKWLYVENPLTRALILGFLGCQWRCNLCPQGIPGYSMVVQVHVNLIPQRTLLTFRFFYLGGAEPGHFNCCKWLPVPYIADVLMAVKFFPFFSWDSPSRLVEVLDDTSSAELQSHGAWSDGYSRLVSSRKRWRLSLHPMHQAYFIQMPGYSDVTKLVAAHLKCCFKLYWIPSADRTDL
jgi:hypothetical protein